MPRAGGGTWRFGGVMPGRNDIAQELVTGVPSFRNLQFESPASALADYILTERVKRGGRIANIINSAASTGGETIEDLSKRSKSFYRNTGEFIPPNVIGELLSEGRTLQRNAMPEIKDSSQELAHILARFFAGNRGEYNLLGTSRIINQLEGQGIKQRFEPSIPAFMDEVINIVYEGIPKRFDMPAIPGWRGKHSFSATEQGVNELIGLPSQSDMRKVVERFLNARRRKPPKIYRPEIIIPD